MYTLISSIILGAITGFIVEYKTEKWYRFYFGAIVLGAVIGVVVGALITFFLPYHTKTQETKLKIETLQDNTSTTGRFYVGSGQINTEMRYMMYINDTQGMYLKDIPVSNTTIQYIPENSTPYLLEIMQVSTNDPINQFSIPQIQPPIYIIYVPKGTIKQSYNLDAQ